AVSLLLSAHCSLLTALSSLTLKKKNIAHEDDVQNTLADIKKKHNREPVFHRNVDGAVFTLPFFKNDLRFCFR
ncbi:MAG TPA: hypothetical protein VLA58_01660, partial [Chitinophagaceae bacterium]|nr:hypothetical protein [Chitinophagaceae bacterium]